MAAPDTFYVIDFDRCLGNIDASFELLKDVVHDLSIMDRNIFQSARDKSESQGLSFSAFEFLAKNVDDIDLDLIEKHYIKRAKVVTYNLLEPGADQFIDFLNTNNHNFCIMSYGEKRWQMLKISAAGFHNVPAVIVDERRKSRNIASWFDSENDYFVVPDFCRTNNKTLVASRIVLIDDKPDAFDSMIDGMCGYLVSKNDNNFEIHQKKVPKFVNLVSNIGNIVDFEL